MAVQGPSAEDEESKRARTAEYYRRQEERGFRQDEIERLERKVTEIQVVAGLAFLTALVALLGSCGLFQ